MRIREEITDYVKQSLQAMEPGSIVYLFGSRTDDSAKGGDIDLLWITEERVDLMNKIKFKVDFYKRFGWQKIDLVNFTFKEVNPFKKSVLENAIQL